MAGSNQLQYNLGSILSLTLRIIAHQNQIQLRLFHATLTAEFDSWDEDDVYEIWNVEARNLFKPVELLKWQCSMPVPVTSSIMTIKTAASEYSKCIRTASGQTGERGKLQVDALIITTLHALSFK